MHSSGLILYIILLGNNNDNNLFISSAYLLHDYFQMRIPKL